MAHKLPAPESRLPQLAEGAEQAFGEILSTSADQEKDAVLAAGIDLGRIEAMDFVATVATSSMLAVYENIKKSKGWRFLRNPKSGDASPYSSLEEFCEVKLGRSYRRLRELAANKQTLGDAFEQAERLGLRQVDYNVIKALPAPKQEILKEALTDGATKEEVQRALRELAAADQQEINKLTEDLANANTRLEVEEEKYQKADSERTSLQQRLKRKVAADTDWPDALMPITDQIAACKRDIDHAFSKLETARITVLQLEMPEDQRPKFEAALAHVAEVYASALVSAERHYLKDQVIFAQTLGAFLADGE